jgi:uncharacterized protein YgiM (DUF1202 family)
MEHWKHVGALLTGIAALMTAAVSIFSFLNSAQKHNISIIASLEDKNNTVYAFVYDKDGHANLRDNPSVEANIITILDNGTKIEVIEKKYNWFKVKTLNGKLGFIYYDRLKF